MRAGSSVSSPMDEHARPRPDAGGAGDCCFSFDGKYFQARELTLVPRPVQTPHPPVRIAANSPDTFPLAARHRLPIFASPLINPPDKLNAGLAVYRQGLPAGTVNDTTLAFPVHFHGRSRRAPQGRYHSFGRSRATSTRFAPDSPLEGTGFEPSVPLLRKVSRLLPKGDAGPISWMGSLSTGRLARRRWSAAGPLSRPSLSRRDRWFESCLLQRRVHEPSVAVRQAKLTWSCR